jgi:hypothetical protein
MIKPFCTEESRKKRRVGAFAFILEDSSWDKKRIVTQVPSSKGTTKGVISQAKLKINMKNKNNSKLETKHSFQLFSPSFSLNFFVLRMLIV